MGRVERVADGVTVHWAGPARQPTRRAHRASPVRSYRVAVPNPEPGPDQFALYAEVDRRERVAAALAGNAGLEGTAEVAAAVCRGLVNAGMAPITVLLCLVHTGGDPRRAVRALWGLPYDERRELARALTGHLGLDGPSVVRLITEVGESRADAWAYLDSPSHGSRPPCRP